MTHLLNLPGLGGVASSDPDTETPSTTHALYQPVIPTIPAHQAPKLREPRRHRPATATVGQPRKRICLPKHEHTVPKFQDLVLPTQAELDGKTEVKVSPWAASGMPRGFTSWLAFFRHYHRSQQGYSLDMLQYIQYVYAHYARCFTRTYYEPVQGVCQHECSGQCEFFSLTRQPKDVSNRVVLQIYICWISGNLHVCTPALCKHLKHYRETRVCALTQQTHPLEFVQQLEYMPTLQTQGRWTAHAVKTHNRKNMYRKKAQRASVHTHRRLRICRHARLENPQLSEHRVSLAYKLVKKLMHHQRDVRFEQPEIDYLVWLCEATWKLVVQSPAYDFNTQVSGNIVRVCRETWL